MKKKKETKLEKLEREIGELKKQAHQHFPIPVYIPPVYVQPTYLYNSCSGCPNFGKGACWCINGSRFTTGYLTVGSTTDLNVSTGNITFTGGN